MAVLLPALLGAFLVAPRAPARAEEPAAPNERAERLFDEGYPTELKKAVYRALDRGRDWLLSRQGPGGRFVAGARGPGGRYALGTNALALLALLQSGVPGDAPAIERGFDALRGEALTETYSVAVLLMALDARYEPASDPFVVEEVDRYGRRRDEEPCARAISPADLAWMKRGVAFLVANQNAAGTWRYPSGGHDLSNTQYALLGLHAASRCGVNVPPSTWLAALNAVLDHQEAAGEAVEYQANEVRGRYRFQWMERALARGFRYTPQSPHVTGSMTTAGLAALYICQARLWRTRAFTGALRARTERGIRDAKAWMQENFSVRENPGLGLAWHYYYLYGLERAGVIGRFRMLGPFDWYLEGAHVLLEDQAANGSWQGDLVETCFAILFLKRAAVRVAPAPVVVTPREAPAPPPAGPAPEPAAPPSLGDEAEALLRLGAAVKGLCDPDPEVAFCAARDLARLRDPRALPALARALGTHADVEVRVAVAEAIARLGVAEGAAPLVEALAAEEPAVRAAADAALRQLTGWQEPAPALAEDRRGRAALQRRWREWLGSNEARLRQRLGQAPAAHGAPQKGS